MPVRPGPGPSNGEGQVGDQAATELAVPREPHAVLRVHAEVVAAAREAGLAISAVGAHQVRAVTHLDVSHDDSVRAGRILGALLA